MPEPIARCRLVNGRRAIATAEGVQHVVDGVNGENAIRAVAATSADAWLQAVEQARALGMPYGGHRFFA
jgi:hypothetical protein